MDYLPPVVINVEGQITDLQTKLAEAQALLASYRDSGPYSVDVTANTEQAVDNVNALQNALNSLPNKKQIEITVNKINLDNITFDAKTLKAAATAAQKVLVEEFDKTLIPAYVTFEQDGEYGLAKAAEGAKTAIQDYFDEQSNTIKAYIKFDNSEEKGLGKACADAKEALQQCMNDGITTHIVFDVDTTVDNFTNVINAAKDDYEQYGTPVRIRIEADGDIAENYQRTVRRTEEKVRRVVETVKDFTEEPVEESLPSTSPYKKDTRGKWRDELGRYVKSAIAEQRNDEGSVESLGFESLYHGTSVSFLRKILKNGLLPGIGATRNTFGRGVYTTDEFTDAIIYADQAVRSAPYGLPTYTTSRTFKDDSFNIDVLAQDKLWQPAPAVLKIDVPRKTIEAITSKDLQKEVEGYVEYVMGEGNPYPHNVLGDLFGDYTTLHIVDAGQFVTPLSYVAKDIKEVFAFPDYAKVTAGLTDDFQSLEEAFLDEAVDMKDVFEKSISNVKNTMLREARKASKQIKQNRSDEGAVEGLSFDPPIRQVYTVPDEYIIEPDFVYEAIHGRWFEAANKITPFDATKLVKNALAPFGFKTKIFPQKYASMSKGFLDQLTNAISDEKDSDAQTIWLDMRRDVFQGDLPGSAGVLLEWHKITDTSPTQLIGLHPSYLSPANALHEVAHAVTPDKFLENYSLDEFDNVHSLKWLKNFARIMTLQGFVADAEGLAGFAGAVQQVAEENKNWKSQLQINDTIFDKFFKINPRQALKNLMNDAGAVEGLNFQINDNERNSIERRSELGLSTESLYEDALFKLPSKPEPELDNFLISPDLVYTFVDGVLNKNVLSSSELTKTGVLALAKEMLVKNGFTFWTGATTDEEYLPRDIVAPLLKNGLIYDPKTVAVLAHNKFFNVFDDAQAFVSSVAYDPPTLSEARTPEEVRNKGSQATYPSRAMFFRSYGNTPPIVHHELAHVFAADSLYRISEIEKGEPPENLSNIHRVQWLKTYAHLLQDDGIKRGASYINAVLDEVRTFIAEDLPSYEPPPPWVPTPEKWYKVRDNSLYERVHEEFPYQLPLMRRLQKFAKTVGFEYDTGDAGAVEGLAFSPFKDLFNAIQTSTIQSQDSVSEVNDSAIGIGRSFSVFKDLADAIKTSMQKFGDPSDPLRSLKDLAEITGQPLSRLRSWTKDSSFPKRFDAPVVRRNVGGRTPYLYDVKEVLEFVKLQEQKANTTAAGTVQRFLPVDKNKVFDPSELMTIQDIAAYGNMDVTKAGYLPRLILDFPRAVATQGKRQFWQAEEIAQWFEARSTAPIVDPQEVLRMAREYTGANLIRQNVAAWKSWKTDNFPTPINPWNTPGTNLGYLYQREDIEKWLRTSDTIAKLRLANKGAQQAFKNLGDEGNVRPSVMSTMLGIMTQVPFLDAAVKLFSHGDIKQGLLATATGAVVGGALPGLEVASQLINRRRSQRSMMESLIESPAINESLPDLAVLADTARRVRGSLESSVPQMNDLERYVQMYPVQISSLRQAMADALPNFESPVKDLLNASDMIGKMKADLSKFDKVFEVFVQDRETLLNDISPLMKGLQLPGFRVGTNALATDVNRILRGENVLSYIPSDMTQKLGPLVEAANAKLEVFDLKRMLGENLSGDRIPSVITAAQEATAAQQAAVDAVRPQFEQWKTTIEETTAAYKKMLSLGRWTGSRQVALASQLSELQSLQQKIQKLDVNVDTTRAKEQLLLLHQYARHPETMPVGIHLPMELGATSNMLQGIQQRITIAQGNAVADALSHKPGKEGALGGLFGWLGAKGEGGKREGMLTALGWGKGGGIPLPFLGAVGGGMAGFGSILGLGGFGAEHVLTTGLGIAGSAVGGLIGGGILAGTTLAVAGVGLGTDLAGIGQASKDAKATYSNYASYQQAVSQFGPKSSQATSALQTFLTSLSSVPQAAQSAVLGLDKTLYAFRNMFDKLTGPAEAIGAQILQQAVTVGQAYLPTIGKFAFENMNILKKGLQPFFSWLQNAGPQGGLGIFIELEKLFQKRLPAAINAFVQGFELIAKTIGAVAPQTGQFINKISNFLTKENTSGFGKWMTHVEHLITLFHEWAGLIKYLILDIAKLFSFSAGLAGGPTGIVVTLTGYLKELYGYLNKQGPGSNLASLFNVHKREVMDILNLAIQLVAELGKAYITIAPTVTLFFVGILDIVTKIVGELERISKWHNPLGEVAKVGVAGIGFGILLRQMGLLTPLLSGANREASIFAKTIGLLGFSNLLGKKRLFKNIEDDAGNVIGRERVGRTGMLSYLLGARGVGEEDKFVVGKIKDTFGKAGREARKEARNASKIVRDAMRDSGYVQQEFDFGHGKAHEKELKKTESFMSRFKKTLKTGRSDAGFVDFGQIFGKAKGGEKEVSNLKKLGEEGEKIKKAFSGVGSSIIKIGGDFASFGKTALKAVLGVIPGLLGFDVAEGATTLSTLALNAALTLGVIGALVLVGVAIYEMIKHWKTVEKVVGDVVKFLKEVVVEAFHGIVDAAKFLWKGVEEYFKLLKFEFVTLPKLILGWVGDAGKWLYNIGKDIVNGLIKGVESMFRDAGRVMLRLAGSLLGPFKSILGIFSPSTVTTGLGQYVVQGLTNGITNNSNQAISAAKTLSQGIINAFGSLKGVSGVAGAVNSLASVFRNLASVFTNLQKAAAASSNSGLQLYAIGVALQNISTDAPGLMVKLEQIVGVFQGMSNNRGLKTVASIMSNLNSVFSNLQGAASGAANVTWNSMMRISNALKLVSWFAPGMVTNIGSIAKAFAGIGTPARTTTALVPLGNVTQFTKAVPSTQVLQTLNSTLVSVGNMFTNFSNMAQNAANVTVKSVGQITNAINTLTAVPKGGGLSAIQTMTNGIKTIMSSISSFSNQGSQGINANGLAFNYKPQTALQNIHTLNQELVGIGNMFNNFATIAKNANKVTPTTFGSITNAIGTITSHAKTMSSSIQTITSAFGQLGNSQGLPLLKGNITPIQALNRELVSVGNMMGNFGTITSKTGNVSKSGLDKIVTALKLIKNHSTAMAGDIHGILNAFVTGGSGSLLTGDTSKQINSMTKAFGSLLSLFNQIGSTSGSAQSVTGNNFKKMGTAINNVSTLLNQLVTVFAGASTRLQNLGGFDGLIRHINQMLTILQKLPQLFVGMATAAYVAQANMKAPLGLIALQIQAIGSSLAGLPDALRNAKAGIVGQLTALVNNMVNLLTGATTYQKFVSAGAAMMSGLVAGINQGSAHVATTLTGVAATSIAHFRGPQGINAKSPSKAMIPLGYSMMEGLAKGIGDGKGLVKTSLVAAVPRAINAPTGSGHAGGGMNVTAHFTINAPGGNTDTIKRAIEKDSAENFAKAALTAMRAGAGTVYG